jgi:molybdopterin/thiamine biosynthesis adenylyltransferase
MDLWFLNDQKLLKREREAISAIQQSAEWLLGVEWSLCGNKLCATVIIRAHNHDYDLRLVYPTLFPQVPPVVFPLNASSRLSEHQYGGAAGPLCLEWGPDNWQPEVTAAQVLTSAYKLFDIENPLGEQTTTPNEAAISRVAPSRHALNPGQELRHQYARFYIADQTLKHLTGLSDNACGTVRFSTHSRNKSFLAFVHEIQNGESVWNDPTTPTFLRGKDDKDMRTGAFFKTNSDSKTIQTASTTSDVVNILRASGYESRISLNGSVIEFDGGEIIPFGILILDHYGNPHFLYQLDDGNTATAAQIQSNSSQEVKRTPANLDGLSGKKVGIVGLGSAGSKISVSLARMGVRRFYLVDYDVFLPENAERNALDWSNLGDHKVDGTQEALQRIGVDFDIEVSRTDITGQESSAMVAVVLDHLGSCDLVIDATADPKVFNLLSAMASVYKKPLVWLEIYGGGFGGMIARSRPELDPPPQMMRTAYLGFCSHNPAPENMRSGATNDYGTENENGVIYQASDSDVAIIAHHAARLATDTALTTDNSTYPYSMYLIGLDKAWVFEAPFATIPIATAHLLQSKLEVTEEIHAALDNENTEFIGSLIKKLDAANSSAGNPPTT